MNHQSGLSGKDQSEYSIGKLPLINARALVIAEGLMHRIFFIAGSCLSESRRVRQIIEKKLVHFSIPAVCR